MGILSMQHVSLVSLSQIEFSLDTQMLLFLFCRQKVIPSGEEETSPALRRLTVETIVTCTSAS